MTPHYCEACLVTLDRAARLCETCRKAQQDIRRAWKAVTAAQLWHQWDLR